MQFVYFIDLHLFVLITLKILHIFTLVWLEMERGAGGDWLVACRCVAVKEGETTETSQTLAGEWQRKLAERGDKAAA